MRSLARSAHANVKVGAIEVVGMPAVDVPSAGSLSASTWPSWMSLHKRTGEPPLMADPLFISY